MLRPLFRRGHEQDDGQSQMRCEGKPKAPSNAFINLIPRRKRPKRYPTKETHNKDHKEIQPAQSHARTNNVF